MAEGGAPMDQKAHENGYLRFLSLMKVGTIASAIVAAFVVFLIASSR